MFFFQKSDPLKMWNPTNKKRPSPTHVVIAGCNSAVFCQCRTELYKCPSVPSFGKNNKNKKEFRVYLYEFNVMTIIPGRRGGGVGIRISWKQKIGGEGCMDLTYIILVHAPSCWTLSVKHLQISVLLQSSRIHAYPTQKTDWNLH